MISKQIKKLRTEKKLSQEALAKVLNVSHKTISHWESDYSQPSLAQVVQMKKFFDVDYEDLLE